jgi:uncharacterized protein YigA (DUF484 family)
MGAVAKVPTDGEVAAFLRSHPRFLADNPALYGGLVPPTRVHGEILADHMTAMVRSARAHASAMTERADDVLAAGRASAGLSARVQEAVLALMRAQDKVDCITTELPALLAVDSVALCAEAELPGVSHSLAPGVSHSLAPGVSHSLAPGIRLLPPGTVARVLGGRHAVFGEGGADAALLHGEASELARHEALVLVPGQGPPALLALVVRDGACLDPAQGAGALAFLGRAAAAALGR